MIFSVKFPNIKIGQWKPIVFHHYFHVKCVNYWQTSDRSAWTYLTKNWIIDLVILIKSNIKSSTFFIQLGCNNIDKSKIATCIISSSALALDSRCDVIALLTSRFSENINVTSMYPYLMKTINDWFLNWFRAANGLRSLNMNV